MQKKKDMHNGKNVSSEKGVMVELRGFEPLTSTMRIRPKGLFKSIFSLKHIKTGTFTGKIREN